MALHTEQAQLFETGDFLPREIRHVCYHNSHEFVGSGLFLDCLIQHRSLQADLWSPRSIVLEAGNITVLAAYNNSRPRSKDISIRRLAQMAKLDALG